jgi:hypothetical protein
MGSSDDLRFFGQETAGGDLQSEADRDGSFGLFDLFPVVATVRLSAPTGEA